jgi:hypothetical protein
MNFFFTFHIVSDPDSDPEMCKSVSASKAFRDKLTLYS